MIYFQSQSSTFATVVGLLLFYLDPTADASMGVHHACCHGSGQRVDEQSDETDEQEQQEQFQNEPLVVSPDDVLESLEWIHEPHERSVRTTIHTTQQSLVISPVFALLNPRSM